MKKLLLLSALLIFACSSDESSDTNDNNNAQNDSIIGTWKLYNIQIFNQNDELLMDFIISGTDCFDMGDCQLNSDYVEFTDSTFTAYTFWEEESSDCQNGDIMIVDGCTNVYISTASYNLNNSIINYSDYIEENLICNETTEPQDDSTPFSIENDKLKIYNQTQQIECFDEPHYYVFTYQRQ
tara:strand:- start:339 stop:884 length:546 start_codon:yes stop_codon:yes gene_type:complete